ncbi:hypothetical protein [Streptomyces avermitilis]|uniref:Putative integrase n=1 Tax=Streptomyces avermitilis TaxID=33903 RepID=A0A224ANE9_STRAX|nr:hypothetical protein [Streptomyces avermitilis]BBA21061.1 putative integrase [Streptomyces avermitilis]GDY68166.1 hypothetical protein SAV14893_075590 [Streptomyces avermitilis]GDY71481.1 hypothetical protein SAV31267_009660 [Streptomyces avermitilis]
MNTWTTPLRTGLPLTYDGEQFTVAEIEGRRILLQQISAEGRPTWRQIDLSVLLAHPSTEFLVDTPPAQPAVAVTLGDLSTAEDDALTTRFRHIQEVRSGYQLGSAELVLEGEPRPDYAPGVPLMHRTRQRLPNSASA